MILIGSAFLELVHEISTSPEHVAALLEDPYVSAAMLVPSYRASRVLEIAGSVLWLCGTAYVGDDAELVWVLGDDRPLTFVEVIGIVSEIVASIHECFGGELVGLYMASFAEDLTNAPTATTYLVEARSAVDGSLRSSITCSDRAEADEVYASWSCGDGPWDPSCTTFHVIERDQALLPLGGGDL